MSAVVEAFQSGGTMEQVMQQLTSETESSHTDAAGNNIQSEAVRAVAAANASANDVGGPSTANEVRDVEMEDELTGELQNADAMSDYDIEITLEGEAVNEYLALLDSAGK